MNRETGATYLEGTKALRDAVEREEPLVAILMSEMKRLQDMEPEDRKRELSGRPAYRDLEGPQRAPKTL